MIIRIMYVCKNNDSSFSIANKFNDIFSNVGNNIAKLIIKSNINTSIHDTLEDKNKYSFLYLQLHLHKI